MKTEDRLVQEFGVLMTIEELANLLRRSIGGLRWTIHGNSAAGKTLRMAKVKIGRRVHFRTADVATMIDAGSEK